MKKNKNSTNTCSEIIGAIIFSVPLLFFSAIAINAFDLSQLAQAINTQTNELQNAFYATETNAQANALQNNLLTLPLLLAILVLTEIIFRGILQPKIGLKATAVLYAVIYSLFTATSFTNYVPLLLYFLAVGVWLGVLKELEGLKATIAAVTFYLLLTLATSITSPYFPTIALSAFMLLAPFYWMWKNNQTSFSQALQKLAATREQLAQNMLKGACWTLAMFFVVAMIGITTLALGFNDQAKVLEKVTSLPLYILVFAIVIAPISEEVFFRGFLSPRIGVIASSILFALAHFSYGSKVEIIGAFAVGIMLALQLKQHKTLVVPITAHVLFNLISITLMTLASP
ncbi:CPBP family intramembrane metalloprotease [Candidatus Micrarchaeota archaeon]|nr:CPBP family intramembrane metalloprotease [Candidatus Micrarchaeota archaeon]